MLPYFIIPNLFVQLNYHFMISISWVLIAWQVGFYEVYRYTKIHEIFSKSLKQFLLFLLINFAFLGFYNISLESIRTMIFVLVSFLFVIGIKYSVYFFLRKLRVIYGGNFRRVVIVGEGKNVKQLSSFFNNNVDYGYNLIKVFDTPKENDESIENIFDFIINNGIDEIYYSLSDFKSKYLNEMIDFADNNLKVLKLLPLGKEVLSMNWKFDYYDYIPILSIRDIPLDKVANKYIKRLFDILFSLIVIFGVLSWLTPILAVFIKLETKGPIFFKQKRNGLNYKEFYCYKFRSMKLNDIADLHQVSKNDPRVTRLGRLLRKTSIDELPQFFNVLRGEMSVVGPRPHMVSHTEMYARRVDKFMVRHFIKPGITGLAQTRGFRGEVVKDEDIIRRVKYDIFYLENWSLLLDFKIVIMTIYNALKGEEKAY